MKILTLMEAERAALLAALLYTGWNKLAAARLLGVHRSSLYRKLRRHSITVRPELV